MIHETLILKSKLNSPSKLKCMRRRRCGSLSETILEKRLTTITAGAGYGKTALAAQALSGLDARIIWYRLDRADGNLPTFLRYLVRGIQEIFPKFGSAALMGYLSKSFGNALGQAHLRQLLAEMETCLDKNLVLVLDDFHQVQESSAIKEVLNFFLRHAAPSVHVILISRKSISLSLSRFKAQRQLLEIRSADLVFSREETAFLFKEIFQVKWDPDLYDRMYDLTQGYVNRDVLIEMLWPDQDRQFDAGDIHFEALSGELTS